jgi:hypothetical protein
MAIRYYILGGLCVFGLSGVLIAGAPAQKTKSFGAWYVMSDTEKASDHKNHWVRLGQSQNDDDKPVGDWIDAEWSLEKREIKMSINILDCDKDGRSFERLSSFEAKQWTSVGAKAAAVKYQAAANDWIKQATSQCTERKAGNIFKIAKLDLAMKDFLNRIGKYATPAKGVK